MTSDEAVKLIGAVSELIGVLIWPAALVFLFVYFRKSIGSFISNLGEFSVRTPAFEATAKRQAAEAAASLTVATLSRSPGEGVQVENIDPKDIADAVVPAGRSQRRIRKSVVLWVDDRPNNNIYERQALEALGIEIDLSESTEDALRRIRREPFDLIISDMGRPPDARAGYTLLDELRKAGNRTPFVIYAGSKLPEHVREGRERGAAGVTNDPQELFNMVVRILGRQ